MKNIVEEIFEHAKQMGLNQKKIQELTGIKQSMLSRIKNGKQSPTLCTITKIANAVNYDVIKHNL